MAGTPIILIHGTGLGAWSWEPVARLLEAAGRTVHAVDLKGFGTRADELSPSITLADHAADVTDVIDQIDGDVLLVGHSYGCYVACEAANARSSRIAGVILVDGPPAIRGKSLFDQVPEFAPLFEALASKDVPGLIEALPVDLLGLQPKQMPAGILPTRAPTRPSMDPAISDASELARGHFVGFKEFPLSAGFAEHAKKLGWPVSMIEGGHMTLFTEPAEVARIILDF